MYHVKGVRAHTRVLLYPHMCIAELRNSEKSTRLRRRATGDDTFLPRIGGRRRERQREIRECPLDETPGSCPAQPLSRRNVAVVSGTRIPSRILARASIISRRVVVVAGSQSARRNFRHLQFSHFVRSYRNSLICASGQDGIQIISLRKRRVEFIVRKRRAE